MDSGKLTVLVQAMPPALGAPADLTQRLQHAHPAVTVRLVESPEALAAALVADGADGAIGFASPTVVEALPRAHRQARLPHASARLCPLPPQQSRRRRVRRPSTSPRSARIWDHFIEFMSDNIRRFADGRPLLGLVDRHAGY